MGVGVVKTISGSIYTVVGMRKSHQSCKPKRINTRLLVQRNPIRVEA